MTVAAAGGRGGPTPPRPLELQIARHRHVTALQGEVERGVAGRAEGESGGDGPSPHQQLTRLQSRCFVSNRPGHPYF